jgi:hypothetical protein
MIANYARDRKVPSFKSKLRSQVDQLQQIIDKSELSLTNQNCRIQVDIIASLHINLKSTNIFFLEWTSFINNWIS